MREEQEDLTELVEVDEDTPFVLHPGEFVLGSTLERVRLPDDLVARLEGKWSLGRLGLLIHSPAGFIDPGWEGHVTLELSNVANLPVTIYPGMKIGQYPPCSSPSRRRRRTAPAISVKYGAARPDTIPLLPELPARARRLILVTGGTGTSAATSFTSCAGATFRFVPGATRARRRRSRRGDASLWVAT